MYGVRFSPGVVTHLALYTLDSEAETAATSLRFQSSPTPNGECDDLPPSQLGRRILVSILTYPEG